MQRGPVLRDIVRIHPEEQPLNESKHVPDNDHRHEQSSCFTDQKAFCISREWPCCVDITGKKSEKWHAKINEKVCEKPPIRKLGDMQPSRLAFTDYVPSHQQYTGNAPCRIDVLVSLPHIQSRAKVQS